MPALELRLPQSLSPTDATLDAPADGSAGSGSVGSGSIGSRSGVGTTTPLEDACRVHLVRGSGAELSGETENLLRARLRIAALLLFGGFASFLVWHTIRTDLETWSRVALYGCHLACTLMLGTIGLALCNQCRWTTPQLRWVELITFGLPLGFFLLLQHEKIVTWIDEHGAVPDVGALWLLMLFTYALFIPNTWQRAAAVLGLMSVAPLLGAITTGLVDVHAGNHLFGDPRVLIESTMLQTLSCVVAVIGVFTINSLRNEAFRAKQLGQYKLKRLIGSGGMGDVYLAEHLLMKRPCAIKVIRPEKAGDPKVLARFEREVQATAKLSHWNSVDIFDYGRADDGTFYYVMEFLPGMNLSELVRRYGPMPPARALHLVRQTCDALQEAHDVGLVHRDVKPANVFAAARGGQYDVAKILDFGLAKPLADLAAAQLTQEGTITGSPLYMSPEQAIGSREPDARSDIYSLGAVLYYLLTGRTPFADENPMKVLIAHAHEPPPPPSQHADVPDDVELIVMACLQKSPDDRYQTAAELAAAIEECDDYGEWTREAAQSWWQQHETQHVALRADELSVGMHL